ncbi:MAG TPA: peptide deformylase [Steroidobacteraceae bacterium]|nr:peptide deformylase [Steroidobacteraceae bacterium]
MSGILQLGDPRLRLTSAKVAHDDPQLPQDLRDLAAALQSFRKEHRWGRAVAAPQLGIAKRAIVFDIGAGPFFVLNPAVDWLSAETFELWDDCMCMPSIAVKVTRACSLTRSFVDEFMRPTRLDRVSPELSELIQHELDHLDGILLTDRMIPEWGVVARELRGIAQPMLRGNKKVHAA